MTHGLGRRPPADTRHLDLYPLRAVMPRTVTAVERVLPLPTQYRDNYDQGQEGACFPAGTLIQSADGTWRPIESLRLLDDVRTAEGNTGKVYQTMVRWHDQGLMHIRLRGHAGVKMTPEHPILTARGYVPATEIQIGDQVALTRAIYDAPAEHIDVARYLPAATSRRATNGTRRYHDRHGGSTTVTIVPVPDQLVLTTSLARLIGLYLTEGHTSQQKTVWTFGGHERETLVAETTALIRNALGAEAHLQTRLNGAINVVLHGIRWRALFEGMCGTGSQAKRIPSEIASASDGVRRAALDGWLAGDGHRRRTEVMGVTISPTLALGMYAIATDLGLCPTLSRSKPSVNRHAATRQERWEVHIPEGDGHRPEMDERAVWRTVSAIAREDWAGFVYNVAVSGDQSYVAEGFGVHNCVGFSCSWAMSLLNRRYYAAQWLYEEARRRDSFPGESYDGTEVRAGLDVLRDTGHRRIFRGETRDSNFAEGINEFRWATDVDQVRTALSVGAPVILGIDWPWSFFEPVRKGREWWLPEPDGDIAGGHAIVCYGASDKRQAVRLCNSWGTAYPLVWLPYRALDHLLDGFEAPGECAVIVDRN